MTKIIDHITHGGTRIKAAHSFSRSFLKRLERDGFKDVSHMRVGRFSVTVVRSTWTGHRSLVIAQAYDEPVCSDGSIMPGHKCWEVSKRDRLSQVKRVDDLLPGHPMAAEVRKDIAAERKFYQS